MQVLSSIALHLVKECLFALHLMEVSLFALHLMEDCLTILNLDLKLKLERQMSIHLMTK